jgi:hypothetical protein
VLLTPAVGPVLEVVVLPTLSEKAQLSLTSGVDDGVDQPPYPIHLWIPLSEVPVSKSNGVVAMVAGSKWG